MDTHVYDVRVIRAQGIDALDSSVESPNPKLRGIGYAILALAEAVKLLAEAVDNTSKK